MTRKPKRPGRAVAAHEAAHVVVGVHAGLKLVKVGLRDDGKTTGFALFEDNGRQQLAHALCTAAGPAWEKMCGKRGRRWRAGFDLNELGRAGYSLQDAVLLIALARAWLESPEGRAAHELITRALEERDLTGDEVQEILDGRE